MRGQGLPDADLDALAAFMDAVPPVDNPRRDDPATADARARGEAVFNGPAACAACHGGAALTDNALHDVDTADPGAETREMNTPTLRGLFATAPYLHDGRARTVQDLVTTHNAADRHGSTSRLSADEVQDLVAYLMSL
jgi:cytochrome c peroxidase